MAANDNQFASLSAGTWLQGLPILAASDMQRIA
jgi:hypothetical protein